MKYFVNTIVIGALSVACTLCSGDPQKRMRARARWAVLEKRRPMP